MLKTIQYTKTLVNNGNQESITLTADVPEEMEQLQEVVKEMKEKANTLLAKKVDAHPYDGNK